MWSLWGKMRQRERNATTYDSPRCILQQQKGIHSHSIANSTVYNTVYWHYLIVLVPVDGRHHGGSLKFCHSRDHHQNNIKALFINLKAVVSEINVHAQKIYHQ